LNSNAFRHFYNYHFAMNRFLWDEYIASLSNEQFNQASSYSHGSVRSQILHLIDVDALWFMEVQGEEPHDLPDPDSLTGRAAIRHYWDSVEQNMRVYLDHLSDDQLMEKPCPGEDSNLYAWQVLLHVANHGTDHRAQILRLLNDLGVKTTSQDYIFYTYEHPET
jgi:uncharacterized damage-inducible protein DinB